jgi:PPK2 family polyphosphate:nucleotide phosphotransferase
MRFVIAIAALAAAPASANRAVAGKAPVTLRLAPAGLAGAALATPGLGPRGLSIPSLAETSLTLPDLALETLSPHTIAAPTALPASAVPKAAREAAAAPAPAAKRGALPALKAIETAARESAEAGSTAGNAARSFAMAFDGANAADENFTVPDFSSDFGDQLGAMRVEPSKRKRIRLSDYDPDFTGDFDKSDKSAKKKSKKQALKLLKKETARLQALQQRLYAEGKRSVLIAFQAPDTGGKDGTIRWVIGPLNPQGVRVSSFKKPTQEEASHHYLWRIKKELPKAGMIRVFNRSHFEDILVPSVLKTQDAAVVEGRYDEIKAFEKNLAERGVTIVKFFLHISRDEQKRRLQARLDDPEKHWKFDPNDLKSRALWDKYMAVYEKVLARTSTPWAPWYVIPANNKWYRSLAVARILRRTLEAMDPQFPPPPDGLEDIVIPD